MWGRSIDHDESTLHISSQNVIKKCNYNDTVGTVTYTINWLILFRIPGKFLAEWREKEYTARHRSNIVAAVSATQILMPRFQPEYCRHFLEPVYGMIPRRMRSNGVVSQFALALHPDFLLRYTPWQTRYATDLIDNCIFSWWVSLFVQITNLFGMFLVTLLLVTNIA